jgi:putative FmdB family regulatory protein
MPFYEYECPSCRYYLEVLQKLSDPVLRKCPSCGKPGFKRLMSVPVFRLKGSGWYETDFKSDKEGQRNLAGAEPAEAKAEVPEVKAGADDKAAKPEAASAPADNAKAKTTAPGAKSKTSSKPSASAGRSASTKRAAKRPAVRSTRKSSRAATRGSRRR